MLAYKKLLKGLPYFSLKNLAANLIIISVGLVGSGNIFASWVQPLTTKNKLPYFKIYDPDFMLHFNVLCAKYGIDENTQLDEMFSSDEKRGWMEGYL